MILRKLLKMWDKGQPQTRCDRRSIEDDVCGVAQKWFPITREAPRNPMTV